MAGDTLNIFGKSYFFVNGSISGSSNAPAIIDLLTAFAGSNATAGKGISGNTLNGISQLTTGINTLLGTQPDQVSTLPKAFINWIFFDERFNYAGGGFERVGSNGIVKSHQITALIAPKNGYIFVYCSNESPHNVFFDNLQLVHSRGPILEETHYYPFGLTMAGISSKAAGSLENKRKWNKGSELESKEFSDGSGLELYSTQYRSLDPQIGRFWQIDPKPNYEQSLYSAMNNNPISFNDPLGDTVNKNGFTNQQFLGWIAQGLKVGVNANPFSFDKKGNLAVDEKALKKLSKRQQSIAKNLVAAIKSDITFTINKVNKDDKVTSDPGLYIEKDGKRTYQPTFEDMGWRGRTIQTGNKNVRIDIVSPREDRNNDPGTTDTWGQMLPTVPMWMTFFHETGGHSYYRYVEKQSPKQSQANAVDYENWIRLYHQMPLRGYDNSHAPPVEND